MKIVKLAALTALPLAMTITTTVVSAATWDITVTNITHGNHFTPLLLTAHPSNTHIYELGKPASLPLQHMAECGHLDPLLNSPEVGAADADTIANPVGSSVNFLAPGQTTSASIVTSETNLTVVAMVLPTNDAFLGLSQQIPTAAGTYTYYARALDAGTEGNDEVLMTSGNCSYNDVGMMPGAPGMDAGSNGTGVVVPGTPDSNTMIHVHRGVLGDQDPVAGVSDLNSSIHRFHNPVAKIVVTVTP